MKTRSLIAVSKQLCAVAIITLYAITAAQAEKSKTPVIAAKSARPLLEMVFVLDTTGSMSGLLQGAKQKIWDIVNDVMKTPPDKRPEVRIGLVAYRDHGDEYVSRVLPITADLDQVYATLMDYRADGGGDTPEDVRQALADGTDKIGWSPKTSGTTGRAVVQTMFLVGDAPPHEDYTQEPDVFITTTRAVNKGIFVNTIQCGSDSSTTTIWKAIAQRGEGTFFAIAQDGGVETVATPYDEKLTKLGTKMGSTYLAFGGGMGAAGESFRAEASRKVVAMESRVDSVADSSTRESRSGSFYGVAGGASSSGTLASAPMIAYGTAASRAINKALNTYAYDKNDLLTALESGSVTLGKVKESDLPADIRKLSPAARKTEINRRLQERKKLRAEILALAKQRDEFQRAARKKAAGGKANSFDSAVAEALKAQAKKRGLGL